MCSGEEALLFAIPELSCKKIFCRACGQMHPVLCTCSLRERNFTTALTAASAALPLESACLACLCSHFPEACCLFSSLKTETALQGDHKGCVDLWEPKGSSPAWRMRLCSHWSVTLLWATAGIAFCLGGVGDVLTACCLAQCLILAWVALGVKLFVFIAGVHQAECSATS